MLQSLMIDKTLKVIAGKWKVLILWNLHQKESMRFGELKNRIPEVSQRVLTVQLRDLEKNGLVVRTVFQEVPPHVEYRISTSADGLEELYSAICLWGKRHFQSDEGCPDICTDSN